MNINLSLSPAPGITSNYLVVAIYNTTAPATVVASQSFAAPHAAPVNISFTNLNGGTYYVKTFESTDGTPTGVIRHQFLYDPTFGTANVRVDLVLTVGVSTGLKAGTNTYNDTSLAGWNYTLERRGVGSMVDLAKSAANADYQTINTGGFQLLQTGDVFGQGEVFIVHFLPQVTSVAPQQSQTAGAIWAGVKEITSDITLTSSDMGKYCNIKGSTPIVNITLPASNAVVDGTLIAFLSEGGSHIAANIIPAGTDQIKYIGDTWNNADPFTICQGEEVWLAYHNNAWRVMMADGAWRNIGSIVTTYSKNMLNVLPGDGNTYNRAYYPRLWRWINKLETGLLVDDSTWNFRQDNTSQGNPYHFYPNVAKFSRGDASATFRMPLLIKTFDDNNNLKSGGYFRSVGGTDIAGTMVADKVGNFSAYLSGLVIGAHWSDNPAERLIALGVVSWPQTYMNSIPSSPTPITGLSPLGTNPANNETAPFSTNVYCFVRY